MKTKIRKYCVSVYIDQTYLKKTIFNRLLDGISLFVSGAGLISAVWFILSLF